MTVRRFRLSLIAFALVVVSFLYGLPNHMLADEYVHWPQALRFAQGDWHIDPWLSTWPTMNFVVSCVLRVFRAEQLWVGRLVIVVFSLVAFAGFLRLANAVETPARIDTRARDIMALQWFTNPLMLLVCTVLYTDVPALAALIWAAVGVVERRRALFLVAGIATVMFRQTHLVWFATLLAWHLALTWQALPDSSEDSVFKQLAEVVSTERWTLAVGAIAVLGWLVVVATTGGIAFGVNTQPAHHISAGGVPNEFFAMAVWATAFAPLALGTLLTEFTGPKGCRTAIATIAIAVAVMMLAALFFEATQLGNTHPATMALIRNQALQTLNHPLGRVLMFALCAAGALAWWHMDFATLVRPFKRAFFLASALYLLPFSLIEQRYYLPMFTLLAAFRAPLDKRWEWTQVLWSLALSALLLYHVVNKGRFL